MSGLSQKEADDLIALEKIRETEELTLFPIRERHMSLPLRSRDGHEKFRLDINRSLELTTQVTLQTRGRICVPLIRLDIDGPRHQNPDGVWMECPHIHTYRQGYAMRWAEAVPAEHFPNLDDPWRVLHDFLKYCKITKPPHFQRNLFP